MLGLNIIDGYIAYNITYSELMQMNSNEIITNRYALEGPSGITTPYEPIEEKQDSSENINITLQDFIKMSEKDVDYHKHMKVFELLKNTEKAIEWLQDHANLIGIIFISYFMIIVLVIYFKTYKRTPIVVMHHVPTESVNNDSVNNSHDSDSVPINRNPPHSMKHGPTMKLQADIPKFSLDKSEMSLNGLEEMPRKISNMTVFTHNYETGTLEVHDSLQKPKRLSPKIESTIEMNFSSNPSFAKQLTKRGNFIERPTIIDEENSSSISPETSFKKARSSFATHKEKYVHESYYAKGGEFIIEENQRKITRFPDTPIFRHIVSEGLKRQDPKISVSNEEEKTLSFNLKKSSKQMLLPIDEKEVQDYEDDSFKTIKFGQKSSPTKEFLTRINRSKTYKEDDPDYFMSSISQSQRNSRNTHDKNLKASASHGIEDSIKVKKHNSDSKSSKNGKCTTIALINPIPTKLNFDSQSIEPIARVITSTKTNYISKETEQKIIVQNQDDLKRENTVRDYVHMINQDFKQIDSSPERRTKVEPLGINSLTEIRKNDSTSSCEEIKISTSQNSSNRHQGKINLSIGEISQNMSKHVSGQLS